MSLLPIVAHAGDVSIVAAEAQKTSDNTHRISVTLQHKDEGWDHYADEWRVLLQDGTVLGTRTLVHPHVKEQPFTRSLSGVEIPANVDSVFIDARDSVHGRSLQLFEITVPK